jgi:hypothetical protein
MVEIGPARHLANDLRRAGFPAVPERNCGRIMYCNSYACNHISMPVEYSVPAVRVVAPLESYRRLKTVKEGDTLDGPNRLF